MVPMRRRARRNSALDIAPKSHPSTRTDPLVGRRVALSSRNKVVLPAPELPKTDSCSPAATAKETPSSAGVLRRPAKKSLLTFSIE